MRSKNITGQPYQPARHLITSNLNNGKKVLYLKSQWTVNECTTVSDIINTQFSLNTLCIMHYY